MLCHVRGECFIYNWKFYIELVSYQNRIRNSYYTYLYNFYNNSYIEFDSDLNDITVANHMVGFHKSIETYQDDTGTQRWRVLYDDGDIDDINFNRLQEGLFVISLYPDGQIFRNSESSDKL